MDKCNNCDIEIVESNFVSQAVPGLEPYISVKKGKLGGEARSKVICYVCPGMRKGGVKSN